MGWGVRRLSFGVLAALVFIALAAAAGAGGRGRPLASRTGPAGRPRVAAPLAAQRRAPIAPRTAPDVIATVRSEADWILGAQLTDGAIAHYPDRVRILPYVANYAAIGLTRATAVTGDERYVRAAWRWLDWYATHQTADGFVTDHVITDNREMSTGDMDSTDAYAATFLWAAWAAWDQSHNTAAVRTLEAGIGRAIRAMEATLDADGLTWAKPSWRVKYLMDEAEVYVGWRAGAELLRVLGDPRAPVLAQRARTMTRTIESTWDASTGAYDWAIHENGDRERTSWQRLYPDGMQQMWAVAFGLAPASHAEEIVNRFSQSHPYWDRPDDVARRFGDIDPYWPVAGWGLGAADRTAAAKEIVRAASSTSRAWPYHTGISGQVIVLATGGPALP